MMVDKRKFKVKVKKRSKARDLGGKHFDSGRDKQKDAWPLLAFFTCR